MFENIVTEVASGLIVSLILEWLRRRRRVRLPYLPPEPDVRPASVAPAAPRRAGSWSVSFLRIAISMVGGFFLSAVFAGFIEGALNRGNLINFGDPAMIVLVVVSTALVWMVLARFSRR